MIESSVTASEDGELIESSVTASKDWVLIASSVTASEDGVLIESFVTASEDCLHDRILCHSVRGLGSSSNPLSQRQRMVY